MYIYMLVKIKCAVNMYFSAIIYFSYNIAEVVKHFPHAVNDSFTQSKSQDFEC